MTYAIRFDFPEANQPLFAGRLRDGGLGWAPTIRTAELFDNAEAALNTLNHGYGHTALYARVVTVTDGEPVARLDAGFWTAATIMAREG